jgi:DNA modification methylase
MAKKNEPIIAGSDPAFTGLQIVYREAAELEPYASNSRTHSADQIAAIKRSFEKFGFTNPVLLDGNKGIIAGHGRIIGALDMFKAGQSIRMCDGSRVPTIDLSHLSPVEQRAYVIADNQLATLAGWDYNLLKLELDALAELGFELDLLGFGEQLAEILAPETVAGKIDEDQVPNIPNDPVSMAGDLWILGRHRLLCGDSTMTDEVDRLMAGTRADLLHTDPPYGVAYKGGHKEWEGIKNDKLEGDGLVDFLYEAFSSAVPALKPAAPWYVWHADMTTAEFIKALNMVERKLSSHIIWVKNQMGGGFGDYRAKHEPCIYSSGGRAAWYGGRDQSTVWNVDRERDYVHPTQKPVELVRRAIENSSKAGDAVLDLFGGSGSTMIGCEQTGRTAYLMELDPKFVDAIVLRWQAFTGQNAILERDGRTFTEILAERKPDAVLTSSAPPAPKPKRSRAKATA